MSKNKSDFIDISAVLSQYARKWYLFVISVAACLTLAVLYVKMHSPKMGVRANVIVQTDKVNPLANITSPLDIFGSNGYVDDEIFVISSHSLYRDVIRDLGTNQIHRVKYTLLSGRKHMFPDAPLRVVTAPELPDTLSVGISFKVKVNEDGLANITAKRKRNTLAKVKDATLPVTLKTIYGDFTIEPTENMPRGIAFSDNIVYKGYHAAAEDLAELVNATIANKRSNAIELAINTPNSKYGEAVLNKIVELYNLRDIREKNTQGEKTSTFINERLGQLRDELSATELTIQRYKEANNLTDVEVDLKSEAMRRSEIDKALLEAETQAEILKMARDFFMDDNEAESSLAPMPLDSNSGISSSIAEYNKLVLQRIEVASTVKTGNVALQQLDHQIAAMRKNLKASTEKAYQSAMVTVRDLRAEKSRNDATAGRYPTQEREFIDMKRAQEVKHEIYKFLLERSEETEMILANAVPKGQIVDEAYTLNKPLGISNKMLLLIALIMGMCIPPVYLYVKGLLRNRFESREEAERNLDPPVLGEICENRENGDNLVVSARATTSIVELFRLLRTNLQFILSSPGDKVVLITSSKSGEGKSFISINLAASLALLNGKRVALVGMDIRKPQLANYLSIKSSPGITQYLSDSSMDVNTMIQHCPGIDNLDVIVSGPVPPNPGELLASERVEELFAYLRANYDYVIIDSAPIGMVSDSFTLDRVADAAIIVTRVNYTTLTDLRFVNDVYEHNRLKKLSVVVNGTTAQRGYGYGYRER